MPWYRVVVLVCLVSCGFPRPADLVDASEPADTAGPTDAEAIDAVDHDARVDADVGLPPVPTCSRRAPFTSVTPVAGLTLSGARNPHLTADELSIYFTASSMFYVARRISRTEPFGTPVPLTELMIPSAMQGFPNVTPDGLTIFFSASVRGAEPFFGPSRIYVAVRDTVLSQFEAPALAAIGAVEHAADAAPFLTADGKELWFSSTRNSDSIHIWKVPRVGDGFGVASMVRELDKSTPGVLTIEQAPVLSGDKLTVYMMSVDGSGPNGEHVWAAHRDSVNDGFAIPRLVEALGAPLDGTPGWLSPDNCRLYVAAREIYVAAREP